MVIFCKPEANLALDTFVHSFVLRIRLSVSFAGCNPRVVLVQKPLNGFNCKRPRTSQWAAFDWSASTALHDGPQARYTGYLQRNDGLSISHCICAQR